MHSTTQYYVIVTRWWCKVCIEILWDFYEKWTSSSVNWSYIDFFSKGKNVQKVWYSETAWPNANIQTTTENRSYEYLCSRAALVMSLMFVIFCFGWFEHSPFSFPPMVLSKASSSLPDVVFLLFKPCCCLKIGQVTPCQKFGQCCFYPGQSCSNLQEIYDGGVSMIGEGGSSQLNSKQFLGLTTRVKMWGKGKSWQLLTSAPASSSALSLATTIAFAASRMSLLTWTNAFFHRPIH